MLLGYVDRVAALSSPHPSYFLPRDRGENRTEYVRRFFREVRGLGNVLIVTKRGERITARAARMW